MFPISIKSISGSDGLLLVCGGVCLIWTEITGPISLTSGLILSLLWGVTLPTRFKAWTSQLLGLAVSLLGAGIPLTEVLRSGGRGLGVSLVLIVFTLMVGAFLARRLRVDSRVGTLISSGTAICGGSAIAAVSGAVRASAEQTGVAVAIVFILNSLAVFVFPPIGQWLDLSGEEFGVWSALAIHDTSSVVAAALSYGQGAEAVAVPMKLARALWIIPMAAILGRIHAGQAGGKLPWFVGAFLMLAGFFSAFPQYQQQGVFLAGAGKRILVLVLFLIGAAISRQTLRKTGPAPLLFGVLLWLGVSGVSLGMLVFFGDRF